MFYINNDINNSTRYDLSKFMEFNNDNYDSLNSYMLEFLSKLPAFGLYMVKENEGKPDLISYDLYEDTQYWWILMLYNNIFNINELTPNKIISYPSISSIEELYSNANILQKVI